MTRWLLIDVSNWAHKLLHAVGPGQASAVMFRRWYDYVCGKTMPERVVMAFDSPGSFRRELDPTYKANRREAPPGLKELIASVEELAIEECCDIVRHPEFEADDCIATVTKIALEQQRKVIICSTDKDLRQLLVPKLVVIARSVSLTKGIEYYNTTRLKTEYGLRPDQWIDYQSLVGDKSDNIAGCDSIGDKTARELLRAAGSLDDHYAKPFRAKLTDRQRARLSLFRKRGWDLARQMVTLRTDVPLPEGWEVEV